MNKVPRRGKNPANIAKQQNMVEILLEKNELFVPSEKRPSMVLIPSVLLLPCLIGLREPSRHALYLPSI
jgi:hypothetical protein